MTEIILLDQKAVKSLLCSFCLKVKAETISSTYWTPNRLICRRCLRRCTGYARLMELDHDNYCKLFPEKHGAFLTLADIEKRLRGY